MTTMYRVDPMTSDDIAEVARVERRCFSNPWPPAAYRRELRKPEQNHYVVLHALPEPSPPIGGRPGSRRTLARLAQIARRAGEAGSPHIAGFAGMWALYDEAHVTTIGVDPAHRGQGLGELLLTAMFDEAIRRGANLLTLEVRVSNDVAQALYRKYGMEIQGVRRRYYTDNGEDAYIMWSGSLRDPGYLEMIGRLRAAIHERLGYRLIPTPGVADDGRGTVAENVS